MNSITSRTWWAAAGIRALKTAVQSLAPSIPTTVVISAHTDWFSVGWALLSIVATALLMAGASLLTSIAGLPEVNKE